MTANKYVTLWCDATVEFEVETKDGGGIETGPCNTPIDTGIERVEEAREHAREMGWTHRQGKDRCPLHSGHESPEV